MESWSLTKTANDQYSKLAGLFKADEVDTPNIERILNRVRRFREVAGKVDARGLSADELTTLDRHICDSIRERVTRSLSPPATSYHLLAECTRHRSPVTELFTTNYDRQTKMEQIYQHLASMGRSAKSNSNP